MFWNIYIYSIIRMCHCLIVLFDVVLNGYVVTQKQFPLTFEYIFFQLFVITHIFRINERKFILFEKKKIIKAIDNVERSVSIF